MQTRADHDRRCLVLFTKPARAGKVKTRLIGALSAAQAAELHAAFLGDLARRLATGRFHLRIAWALEPWEEDVPELEAACGVESSRQSGGELGTRLYRGLLQAAERFPAVAAVGSDHPELPLATVEDAFRRLERGADAVFGPAADGGYYLVGLRSHVVRLRLFEGIPWSSASVLAESLARCEAEDLEVELLPRGHDVDVPEDLRRLAARLSARELDCPRTRALLEAWGWLDAR